MRSFIRKNQKGMALFLAMMMLSLGSSIALITFQSSSLDLEISRYLEYEAASQYLAESGVDKVLSWVMDPVNSPNQKFFEDLSTIDCVGSTDENSNDPPDLVLSVNDVGQSSDYFSQLASMGYIEKIRFYARKNPVDDQRCTVEVTAISGRGAKKTIQVGLIGNPLGSITAGIQGKGNPNNPSPVWAHWGEIRYTGEDAHLGSQIERVPNKIETIDANGNVYSNIFQSNEDPLMELHVQNRIILEPSFEGEAVSGPNEDGTFDSRPNIFQGDNNEGSMGLDVIDTERLKHFVKQHGEIYTVSPDGNLIWGDDEVKTFDEVFGGSEVFKLVWIEKNTTHDEPVPLTIDGGIYKGYFYFEGSVLISGGAAGREIEVNAPNNGFSQNLVSLSGINLDGLFYVQGEIDLQRKFLAYGALYAGKGFTGDRAADLEVWYNSAFAQSNYQGVRRITTIPGTWSLSSDSQSSTY